ncbi:hypothetical protein CBM2626_A190011 [Cupriavidus taiwanensis]|nr:hypothetical protein CBM2626_A190011 [Cupriavidus taiwanensis]
MSTRRRYYNFSLPKNSNLRFKIKIINAQNFEPHFHHLRFKFLLIEENSEFSAAANENSSPRSWQLALNRKTLLTTPGNSSNALDI